MSEETTSAPLKRPWKDIFLYFLARLFLFIVLTVVIQGIAILMKAPVPLIMSSLLALILALPLSMFLFKGLRVRTTTALAEFDAERKAHKQHIQEQLEGRE